ncbi:MAG: alpha/beta fold hydrolase [Gemmatimonadaceae bacterium]|nr:alpha/beta fold hydrolase [Gemmatimonadaceae bacterium]
MPLPPDLRPPAPLPPDLGPLTDIADVHAAATEAVRRFTTPPAITRRITDPVERAAMPKHMPPGAVHHDAVGSEGRIAWWSWGQPDWPLVACVHGWGGRGTQWGPVAAALLAAQHRVVVLDAPAHGASDGDRASLPAYRNALLRVLDAAGAPRALVGHSLGGLAVLAAIAERAAADQRPLPRAVSIGAPNNVDRPLRRFLNRHRGSEAVHRAMLAQLESRWQFSWAAMDTVHLGAQALAAGGAPLLVVHAADDEQVPVIESEGLAADWPGAVRWLAPDGCGHLRILRDAGVVQRIVDFITAPAG